MNLESAVEFIRAKMALMSENSYQEEMEKTIDTIRRQFERRFDLAGYNLTELRRWDVEMLEGLFKGAVLDTDWGDIHKQLINKFGVSRLGPTGRKVTQQVLKRGRILDLDEYYHVKEFVSNVDNIDKIGEANYSALDQILSAFAPPTSAGEEEPPVTEIRAFSPAGRKRETGPDPIRLEPDEKLCPAHFTLEQRKEFLLARYEETLKHLDHDLDRQQLGYVVTSGLPFIDSPYVRDDAREAQCAFVEHELEYTTTLFLSYAQFTSIEDELERRFGFRRLGPSAQRLAAQLIAEERAPTHHERIIVERFLKQHPRQQIFSSEQKRRIKLALLRPNSDPLPSPPPRPKYKQPNDLSVLRIGAVFRNGLAQGPCRVMAFDDMEVSYDYWIEELNRWMYGTSRRSWGYYKTPTAIFLHEAEPLRVDEIDPEFLTKYRPELPLRFARHPTFAWTDKPFSEREAFDEHLRSIAPDLLSHPPFPAPTISLHPWMRGGRFRKPEIVRAEDGKSISIRDILWTAQRLQATCQKGTSEGVGFYRIGLAHGAPSYHIGQYYDAGGTMKFYEGLQGSVL